MGAELSPEYWWKRARETRAVAAAMHRRDAKEALIRIAQDYERIAKVAEDMQKKAKLNA